MIKWFQVVVYGLLVLPMIFFPVFAEEGSTATTGAATGTTTETTTGTAVAKPAVSAAPALSPLQKVYKRNRKLRKDLREARSKLAIQTARARSLEKKLLQKNIKPVVDDVEFANARGVGTREPESTSFTEFFAGFSWLWLLFSFAMLIVGFWAGMAWLRERNRKKLGGMHLRI